ncbi:MAG: hypothetical protein EBQ99_07570 [Planctomycetes bacterium]|nr:hypothetical protein [Planctomycetota bacterium]
MRLVLPCMVLLLVATTAHGQGSAPARTDPAKPAPGAKAPAAKPAAGAGKGADETKPRLQQVFIVDMAGMVGAGLRHDEMVAAEKEADKFGPNQIIVLKINSGGGSVTEGDKISRTLGRIRDKHRVVAWIEEAISGAAFTAMHCREIYFMKFGTMGSITKFQSTESGQVSATGRDLEAWIERVAEVAEGADRNGDVGRAMVYSPIVVSYTKDPKTGKVTFYRDASGEVMLSDEKDNLTFTATSAMDCGYINGVADTEQELFEAMQLTPGSYEVNPSGKKISDAWQKTLERCKEQAISIQQDLQLAGGNDAAAIGKRIKLYKQMQDIWRQAPPVAMGMEGGGFLIPPEVESLAPDLVEKFQTSMDPKVVIEAIDRCIKELQKQLAASRKRSN